MVRAGQDEELSVAVYYDGKGGRHVNFNVKIYKNNNNTLQHLDVDTF